MQTNKILLSIAGLTLLGLNSASFAMYSPENINKKEQILKSTDPRKIFDIIETAKPGKKDPAYLGEISKILLTLENQDINFDLLTQDDNTPISLAITLKKSDIVDCLLSSGKSKFDQKISGKTLLEIACENNDHETAKVILKYTQ